MAKAKKKSKRPVPAAKPLARPKLTAKKRATAEKADAKYKALAGPRKFTKRTEVSTPEPVKFEKPKKPKNFILCPTCQEKSKKLRSEMGGLQTRQCRRGHYFEVDTWGGFPHSIRRVENIDRPIFVGGSYTDYIYGRFRDDPTGKGQSTHDPKTCTSPSCDHRMCK